MVLLASAVAMLALCVAQLVVWRRAYAQWNQGRAPQLTAAGRVSWTVHLASYVVVLAALLSGLGASADAVWTTSSAAWFTGSMVLVVAGQVLGAVQYVRAGGPPGRSPRTCGGCGPGWPSSVASTTTTWGRTTERRPPGPARQPQRTGTEVGSSVGTTKR